jgi:hypothetical protein
MLREPEKGRFQIDGTEVCAEDERINEMDGERWP